MNWRLLCTKINYKSKDTATKAAAKKKLEPYKCILCDGWHIGKKEQTKWWK